MLNNFKNRITLNLFTGWPGVKRSFGLLGLPMDETSPFHPVTGVPVSQLG